MNPHYPIDFSSIAELVFFQDPDLNFPRLVATVQLGLPADANGQLLGAELWVAQVRDAIVTLALIRAPRPGVAACVTLSVGRRAGAATPLAPLDRLAENLLHRLQARVCADQQHWLRRCAPHAAPVVALRALPPAQPPAPRRITPRKPAASHLRLLPAPQPVARAQDPDLHRLRAALYAPEPELTAQPAARDSNSHRLAIHAMNATLIVVALPIGAAILTHALLRGHSLRGTAAALVATGLTGALLHQSTFGALLALSS